MDNIHSLPSGPCIQWGRGGGAVAPICTPLGLATGLGLHVCTLNGSARLWRSRYNFCAFVIVEHYELIGLKYTRIRAISRLRKQTIDPGFAQDNPDPGIAQIHALRVTCTSVFIVKLQGYRGCLLLVLMPSI